MIVSDKEIAVVGRLLKTARPRHEWYDFVEDPARFVEQLKALKVRADLFTFMQEPHDCEPKHSFYMERESIAVVPVTTFDHWLKKQISDKTRNMIRKAAKSGVELRLLSFDDEFVRGVMDIYQESPIRQGRRFWHYGKDFETNKRELGTFPERSQFVGAFHQGQMIGFFKLTKNANSASLMFIISKIAHRDKAISNAFIAKAVQMCAEMKIPYLQYGSWSRGGLGDFKIKHGFVRFDVPRYFVPLNVIGQLALKLHLHRPTVDFIPEKFRQRMLSLRGAWYSFKYERPRLRTGQ